MMNRGYNPALEEIVLTAEGIKHNTFNKSGMHPVEFKVLIRQRKVETVSAGGIALPDSLTEKEQWKESLAQVVEMGSRAFFDCPDDKPEVGSWVVYREYAGFKFEGKDGDEYQLINDKDVMAGYDYE